MSLAKTAARPGEMPAANGGVRASRTSWNAGEASIDLRVDHSRAQTGRDRPRKVSWWIGDWLQYGNFGTARSTHARLQ